MPKRIWERLAGGFCALALLGIAGPAAAEGYVIQIASVKSEAAAQGEWRRLRKAHPILLGDMELEVQAVDLSGRGLFYRVQTGPFPNQATAEDLCWQLRSEDQDCLVLQR